MGEVGALSEHRSTAELLAGVDEIRTSPHDAGTLELIVVRPALGERVIVEQVHLDLVDGVIGDGWRARGSSRRPDGTPDPDAQVTLVNARAAALIAGPTERWPLAGDQLYVDLLLGGDEVGPGTRLAVGTAVVEITAEPHLGCGKFSRRFGVDALKFVNSAVGRELNLRGVNARVVCAGIVRPGDRVAVTGSAGPRSHAR
jgi:hypothetical protein